MEIAIWLVLAVLTVIAFSALAERLRMSAPLLLMVVGIVASYLPGVPTPELEPEIVLIGILPPLLYSAAHNTSFIDFRNKKGSIASLSVGLVIVTSVAIGFVASWLIPGLPLAAGIALGAVVAPPDAVAATAVARRVGMPTDVVQVLEGESLVNDATALTVLRSAIVAIGGTITAFQVGISFIVAAGGGVLIGLIVAVLYIPLRQRISTPAFDTALSFTVPYIAFIPAESVHASGVVAVVVAGLLIGHRAPTVQSGTARLTTEANWKTVSFLLENSVFLLIGLQLPLLVTALTDDELPLATTVALALAVYAATVVVRFAWVFATGRLPGVRLNADNREKTVIAWAGMRGVVTLAAALTLPMAVPYREVLLFVAFFVVVASLLIQGLTLPWLVRRLRLPPPDPARLALEEAALFDRLAAIGVASLQDERTAADSDDVINRLIARTQDRRNAAWERVAEPAAAETPIEAYGRLRLHMLRAEREAVLAARDEGGYTDEAIRQVIRMLDVEEGMIDPARSPRRADAMELRAPDGVAGMCTHLGMARDLPVPPAPIACQGCVAEGTSWVHLRMCLTCGYVGCCDSSERRHADGHFHSTGHPVMRSVEPGEAWRWCYVDELLG